MAETTPAHPAPMAECLVATLRLSGIPDSLSPAETEVAPAGQQFACQYTVGETVCGQVFEYTDARTVAIRDGDPARAIDCLDYKAYIDESQQAGRETQQHPPQP